MPCLAQEFHYYPTEWKLRSPLAKKKKGPRALCIHFCLHQDPRSTLCFSIDSLAPYRWHGVPFESYISDVLSLSYSSSRYHRSTMAATVLYIPCPPELNLDRSTANTANLSNGCELSPTTSEVGQIDHMSSLKPFGAIPSITFLSTAAIQQRPPRLSSTESTNNILSGTGSTASFSEGTSLRNVNHDVACIIADKVALTIFLAELVTDP